MLLILATTAALLPAMPLTQTTLAAETPGGWPVAVSKVTELNALLVIFIKSAQTP